MEKGSMIEALRELRDKYPVSWEVTGGMEPSLICTIEPEHEYQSIDPPFRLRRRQIRVEPVSAYISIGTPLSMVSVADFMSYGAELYQVALSAFKDRNPLVVLPARLEPTDTNIFHQIPPDLRY